MAGKIRRKDNNRTVLKKGESQRKDGNYDFRWTSPDGKRHSVYAKTLSELREKEKIIEKEIASGVKHDGSTMTVDELFELWFSLKRGVRDTTLHTYTCAYKYEISPLLGSILIRNLSFSNVKRAYIKLLEEHDKKFGTLKTVNQILMQALDFAVDDKLLARNPAKKVFREFVKEMDAHQTKKIAMTQEEQNLFLDFVANHNCYKKWANLIFVLNGTGLRIGEALALQWDDIDFENETINVDKTLVYTKINGKMELSIHAPKTKSSARQVPASPIVKQALLAEIDYQKQNHCSCIDTVDGYGNFVFLSRNGKVRTCSEVDSVVKRMIASYNKSALAQETPILIPDISCHTFRHNFATRLFESGVDSKVVQDILGHASISMTLNTYTDMLPNTRQNEINAIDNFLTPFTPIFTPIETQDMPTYADLCRVL